MKQVAINGFGRIGRNILRAILESPHDDYSIVAVNDLAPVETAALLLELDSTHGRLDRAVARAESRLTGFPSLEESRQILDDLGHDEIVQAWRRAVAGRSLVTIRD